MSASHTAKPLLCGATLRHAHGVTRCWLPFGHPPERQHEGGCDYCSEDYDNDNDHVTLHWTEDREEWPICRPQR